MKLSSTWLVIVGVFSLGGDSIPYQRAQVNTTMSGTPCQRWDSSTPHWHHAEYGGLDGNLCRSDKNNPCPWCYTSDPDLRYDYCFDCCEYRNKD
ncbi:LPA [Branchiostoma lanceolatum]|uniref:LPA protein n=1 Tax=Branchiostoma lanceolatum TaxID=7740 RepID=A0A8K0AFT4_BRALA|nr:LPA [Branchiostoma lanceolatum]